MWESFDIYLCWGLHYYAVRRLSSHELEVESDYLIIVLEDQNIFLWKLNHKLVHYRCGRSRTSTGVTGTLYVQFDCFEAGPLHSVPGRVCGRTTWDTPFSWTLLISTVLFRWLFLFFRSPHLLFSVTFPRFHFYGTRLFILKYSLTKIKFFVEFKFIR